MGDGRDGEVGQARLIGRAAELRQIGPLVASADRGEGRMLLISGEPGIGKSRLLDEVLASAAEAGMGVLRSRAEEFEARRPFGAIAACLGITPGAADARRSGIARVLDGQLPAPPETPTTPGPPETEFRLVEAMVGLVEQLCASSPVVIAIDDLQWADPPSLEVLHRLGRAATELPLLVCGAFRPAPRRPALTRLLRAHEARGGKTLPLPPLPSPDVAELLSLLLGLSPGPRLQTQAAAAGGNPFYLTELVNALRVSDSLTTTATTAEIDAVAVPPPLKVSVLLEMSYLSEETQELLRTASLLGSSFTVADVALVLDRRAVALAPRVSEALDAGVLHAEGSRLAFRHDLLREALYDDVPLSLRKGMHLDIAHTLAGAGAPALDVAEHFLRGASPGDAVALEWLKRAADEATVRAPMIAAELLEQALELFDPSDPDRDRLAADWVLSLEILGRLGDAEAECAELLSRRQPPATEAKLRLCLARALNRRGELDEALAQAALAEEVGGLSAGQRARVIAYASSLPITGRLDIDRAEAIAVRGLREATEHAAEGAQANCAFTLAMVALFRGRFGEAIEWAARARITGEEAPGDRMGPGWHHLHQAAVLLQAQARHGLDRIEEAEAALRRVRQTARQLGFRTLLVTAHSLLISHEFMVGAWDDATTEFDALVDVCAELEERYAYLEVAGGARALIALHRGQPDAARHVLSGVPGPAGPQTGHLAALARAVLCESSGDPGGALEVLGRAWDLASGSGVVLVYQHLAPDLVRLASAVGDRDRSLEASEEMEAMAASNPGAATILGIALRCRGLLDDDTQTLVEAAAALRDSPRPLEQARACEDAADALVRAGHRDDGCRWFDEAIAVYQELEADGDLRRVAARLRALGVGRASRCAPKRPKAGPEALTRSERAVVKLVGEGLSNPEVAERLYLSRHTVKRHLANAMVKLGVTSRRDLRRWPLPTA